MNASRISRRSLLGAAAALIPRLSYAAAPTRLAVIDWALLETCIAIGAAPVAATELVQFRKIVVEPAVPDRVTDLGLRGTPNLELLRIVAPDLILISNFYEYQRPSLERIAPVLSLPVYEAGKPSYPLAEQAALTLGDGWRGQLKRAPMSRKARPSWRRRAAALAHIASGRSSSSASATPVISGPSARTPCSAMCSPRLGLTNAWTDTTSYSAAAPVGLEALARVPEASIVIVEPLPPEVGRTSARQRAVERAPGRESRSRRDYSPRSTISAACRRRGASPGC